MIRTHALRAGVLSVFGAGLGLFVSPAADAAVPITFSGGNGTPLSLTLAEPVSYTITNSFAPFIAPNFVFDAVGDVFGTSYPAVTGTMTFSIDGGTPQTIGYLNSGISVDSITPNAVYTWPNVEIDIPIGSVVVLSAGTLTTTSNVAAAAPAGGSFETWMTGSNGYTISTSGAVVPEPTSLALLAIAGTTLLRRRR